MCQREDEIRAGKKEFFKVVDFEVVLYWEPYFTRPDRFSELEAKNAFTVDVNFPSGRAERYRYDTLEEADDQVGRLKHGHAVYIAKKAFGL